MKRYLINLLVAAGLLIGVGWVARATQAAVTLVEFTATFANNQVTIFWETGSEFSTAGFYVLRSLSAEGPFTAISSFIPAEGGTIGATYSILDTGITTHEIYYYVLEELETSGTTKTYTDDKISVFAGNATPTPTPTETVAPTSSPTITRTPSQSPTPGPSITPSRTPKISKTPTRTPTKTRTPFSNPNFTVTYTPSATGTPSPTQTPTPTTSGTATAESLPTVVYTLAVPTDTVVPKIRSLPTAAPTQTPTPMADQISIIEQLINSGSLVVFGVILLTIAGWAVLSIGGYLLIFRRKS
jgi:hypothetical protein